MTFICLTSCISDYDTEITKLYFIDNFKVHEFGVEIWATSESEERIGIFIEHENIFSCEEQTSRVVYLYNQHGNIINQYLYFSEEDFKEYIKDRYDIE